MQRQVTRIKLFLFIILTMTACSNFLKGIVLFDKATPSPLVIITPKITTAPSSLEISETPTPTATSKPPRSMVPSGGSERFRIEQRSRSPREVMKGIALVLHSAELSTDELSLRIGFENTTDRAFSIIGRFEKHHVVLIDGTGYSYEPLRISENLQNISPPDGFAPGEANVGNIVFPVPLGSEPYELLLSKFDPIRFRLNSPLPAEALVTVTSGNYPLEMTLQSTNEALAPIELRVHSIRVETDSLIFSVGFINTLSQGYKILVGPTARDARLRDVEGTQYKPIAVSNSFQTSIAPEHGWEPGQEYVGTLTFPLPEALSEVSFIFPFYHKLTIRFNETGVVEVRVVSIN